MEYITRIEEILLLSVWKLQKQAYGLAIRKHGSQLLNKNLSVGAVYIPLERLVKKGHLSVWESEPTRTRGGRRKRFYQMTSKGLAALNTVKQMNEEAWTGLPKLVFEN
ncbi:helix-turn-helix transcriptional regulator [candidate division KSB1 bacterium]|nr:helix-turn-helix transcriptional regulator [candidate division KSB1 bacterium]